MNVEVVRANEADAEAIRRVYADAYSENRRLGFPASAESASVVEIKQWILSDLMWVAKIDGELVGAVRLRTSNPEYPTLGRLGVASKYKGQGIGSVLMNAAEKEARQLGCKGVMLTVAEDHPFLSKIYSQRGYRVVGPREPQHSIYNEIVMRLVF